MARTKKRKIFSVLPSLFSDCFRVMCTVLWNFTCRKLSTGNRILTVLKNSSVLCLVVQSCPTLCDPMDCSSPGSAVHGNSPGKNTRVGCHALLQGIFPTQESKHRSPALQVDSLLSEPLGKPKNTGVSSLALLQRIFLTQELNWGLLHCRQMLYQLSYQGSPRGQG